ncbi:MAG: hypothetical protein M0P13_11125 [Fibrobacteraceae bacterium]|nr:hypothetical protein [Fibrobacteraceae bacterium]
MTITSKRIIKLLSASLCPVILSSCLLQGPWSYTPEEEEAYRGIYTLAYLISDRPVSSLCFKRLLALNESMSEDFAFYDSATVKVSGEFSGIDTTITLSPESSSPNCFEGPSDLKPSKGESYSLVADIVWDSSGTKVKSHFSAKANIPSVFSIQHVFAPLASGDFKEVERGDTAYTLSYPNDFNSYKFTSKYDNSVRGGFYSIHYDNISGGENTDNSVNQMLKDFLDSAMLVYSSLDSIVNGGFSANISFDDINSLDTIFIPSYTVPLTNVRFFFYATDEAFVDFENKTLASAEDPRIKAESNVEGGAGLFSGIAVDTFSLYINYTEDDKTQFYSSSAVSHCRDTSWSTKACRQYLPTYCKSSNYKTDECFALAISTALENDFSWDSLIPASADSATKESFRNAGESLYCLANNFPTSDSYCSTFYKECQESEEKNSCKDSLWTYCADNNWNISSKPQCGTALISRYRLQNIHSTVIKKVVNKWCEENTNDTQCKY